MKFEFNYTWLLYSFFLFCFDLFLFVVVPLDDEYSNVCTSDNASWRLVESLSPGISNSREVTMAVV